VHLSRIAKRVQAVVESRCLSCEHARTPESRCLGVEPLTGTGWHLLYGRNSHGGPQGCAVGVQAGGAKMGRASKRLEYMDQVGVWTAGLDDPLVAPDVESSKAMPTPDSTTWVEKKVL
jgi:hypothetical protein